MTADALLAFPTGSTLHLRRNPGDERAACSRPIPPGAVEVGIGATLAAPTCRPCLRAGRPSFRETPELADAVVRLVRRLGERASTDVDALPELVRVDRELDAALHRAVAGCTAAGWSYTDVGRVLGVTRQAAFQRFGRPAAAPAQRESTS